MKKSIYKVLLSSALLVFMVVPVYAQQGAIYRTTYESGAIKRTTYYYLPRPYGSLDSARQFLNNYLNNFLKYYWVDDWESPAKFHRLKYKKAAVFNDRIEFFLKSSKRTLYFSKLFGEKEILCTKTVQVDNKHDGPVYSESIANDNSYYHTGDNGSVFGYSYITEGDFKSSTCSYLADALYTIQNHLIAQHNDSIMAIFKPLAEKYRALKVKPPMTEEQRKYVVQANYLTRVKNYGNAASLYKKVIEIDPTSYPAAYYNLALLFAQQNRFNKAIFYMHEYLLLEPEAQDARAAQDKIYEWDLKVGR